MIQVRRYQGAAQTALKSGFAADPEFVKSKLYKFFDDGHAGRHFILTVKKRRKITRCHSQYVVVVAVLPTSRSEFHF